MAWSFGDSFDLYAAYADMANGYWDSIGSGGSLQAGRFAGSQGLALAAPAIPVKSSGVNDAVHHIVVSFKQTTAISGTSNGQYIELFDGATSQCTINFQGGGAIVLTSGGPAGTVLATYSGAFPVVSTWYSFEFEIVINNTTGSFAVRKNGNSVNDFTATGLNTRPTSTNNYANKIQLGLTAGIVQIFDDLFWQSGAATGTWLGDIRCYTRMPASDVQAQFLRQPSSPGPLTQTVPTVAPSGFVGVGKAFYTQFTAAYSGVVTSAAVLFSTAGTSANMKCCIYADNAGSPGAVLASATAPANPVVVGTNSFTFSPGVTISKGVNYWIAAVADGTGSFGSASSASLFGAFSTTSYAAFPQANPLVSSNQNPVQMAWTYNVAPGNWMVVSEAQQDGVTSYVFDSNSGDADFYGVGSIASTPAAVIATTVRGYMQKSDVGTRTAAVQLKSGGAAIPSLWSAADAAANGATLTNGGQTLNVASATPVTTVRSSTSKASGKLYIEIAYVGTNASGVQLQIGLASAGFVPSNNIGTSNYSGGMFDNGSMTNSSAFFSNSGASFTWSANCVFGLSVDFTSGFFWIAKNNVQVNGGNPAAGTTWVMSFTPATVGALFLALSNYGATSPIGTFTINSTAASQTYAPPTGFTAWDSVVSTTVASPTLTLTTSGWQWAWRTDVVDPNTGAAWTPAAVNAAQIGPKVVS